MTADDLPQPGGVPLDRPFYGAPYGEAVRRFWRRYTQFRGRSSRAEFWWWFLTAWAIDLVLLLVPQIFDQSAPLGESQVGSYLFVLWTLVAIIGNLALGARRLHDANLSGLWQLLYIVPFLGQVAVWVMCLLPPRESGSRFD
jgi:uncharacterized membrane protein YhaH (DUF805 family)